MLKPSKITAWFASAYSEPTPAQVKAWPLIEEGKNVLIMSPTGTGKTFAAFLAVLSELAAREEEGRLGNEIYAVYISPSRALGYDLEKNLQGPLRAVYGEGSGVRVGLRNGDTPAGEREKQFRHPPHVLLTTPESLSILLSQRKWLDRMRRVRWVIVDEIHALAENKRGAHLSLSLERLEYWVEAQEGVEGKRPPQRIGLSATAAPAGTVANFLAGEGRECEVVDAASAKKVELKVYSPLRREPYPPSGYTGKRLIRELARLVEANRATLIFSNTRSGAEAASFWLRRELPELGDQIECHHASLDRDLRQEVEDRLKRGELRAVVCSTSLELGIDIGSIDLVVMLSTPKGVSRALQRTGRAGHNIGAISRGLLMAANMNDLVECCATALLARRRHLDPVRIPEAPLDVLAQHLASMGCVGRWGRSEALSLVRRAHPYARLSDADYEAVLEFLAGGGKALRQQYKEVFGKIVLDDDGFETRAGAVRRDLLENLGVIPSEGMVAVKAGGRTIGMVEETFIRRLNAGDVFILAGRPVRVERLGGMECNVSGAEAAAPAVPRWNANKMPLTNKVAGEIGAFRSELRARLARPDASPKEDTGWISGRLECGMANARIIYRMHAAQRSLSDIPTAEYLLVEEFYSTGETSGGDAAPAVQSLERKGPPKGAGREFPPARHYFFHCLMGRAANDALSRVVAQRLSRLRGGNAIATPDDYGFVLTVAPEQRIEDGEIRSLIALEGFTADLHLALGRSDLLKYHFRNAAQAGLMVYRNYFGERKAARKVQWSSEVIFNVLQQYEPDHVLMREARRDAIHTYIDAETAMRYLENVQQSPVRLRTVDRVPPLSFAMFATKIKEALLVEDPREMMERLYHLWWKKLEE